MSRKKVYGPSAATPALNNAVDFSGVGRPDVETDSSLRNPSSADIDIVAIVGTGRKNPMGIKSIKLSKWLGHGIDNWVWATSDTLRLALQRNDGSVTTLRNCVDGMARCFFPFLTEGRETPLLTEPAGFTRMHAELFVAWLKARDADWATRGGDGIRTSYVRSKSMVCRVHRLGMVHAPMRGLWPDNPFPGASNRRRSAKPLSQTEQQRLADALKSDIVGLHFGRLKISGSEAATVHYVLIAMRTGCNPTPLLEATRDALGDGLKRDTKVLRLHKPRSHATIEKAVRDSSQRDVERVDSADAEEEESSEIRSIPMDAVAIWQRQVSSTEALRENAPDEAKNSPWLYLSARLNDAAGRVVRLSNVMMHDNLIRIVERHGLKGDDGKPLRLSIMRLRQSFAERAWRLSEGDPLQVAAMLGNTPRVAGLHYASVTDEIIATGAEFMGEALYPSFRGNSGARKSVPIRDEGQALERTPTASCSDPRSGDRAPKDGTLCKKFVLCLFCRSFAVVGELDELWRLFSFQIYLQAELRHLDEIHGKEPSESEEVEDLRVIYRRAIDHIDSWTVVKFGKTLPAKAKAKAQDKLHPFWEIEVRRAHAARQLILRTSPPHRSTSAGDAA